MSDWMGEFVQYLDGRLASSLNWVCRYHPDGYELRYCREDLLESDIRTRLDAIHSNVTGTWADERPLEPLGDATATVQIRERAIIIHIRRELGQGVVFSVEPYVGRNLKRFVESCDEFVQV